MNVISPARPPLSANCSTVSTPIGRPIWWWRHSDLVLEGGAIATYFDHTGDVAIRQRCDTGDAFGVRPVGALTDADLEAPRSCW